MEHETPESVYGGREEEQSSGFQARLKDSN